MSIRISKKCYYALRAVFELASRPSGEPVAVQKIASVQDAPPRFLEAILNELRQAEIVVSQRGNGGGYMLARAPEEISVASVIEVIQGPISIGIPPKNSHDAGAYFRGDAAIKKLWHRMDDSMEKVCRETSVSDLVQWERSSNASAVPNYSI